MKIELKDINKKYGKDFQIEHLNMTIESEKFITFLGPSGCGKTSLCLLHIHRRPHWA